MVQNFQNDYTRVNSFFDFKMLYNVYGSKKCSKEWQDKCRVVDFLSAAIIS